MTSLLMTLLLLMSINVVRAGDRDIDSYGGQLQPEKPSRIRLVREDLSFVFQRDSTRFNMIDVRADHVFHNDGPASTIGIGFVCSDGRSPLTDISILVNGKAVVVSYRQVTKRSVVKGMRVDSGDHVYHFTAKMVRGRNTIEQRCAKEAIGSVYHSRMIGYQMSSGSGWAGGVIDTFTLSIDVGVIGDQRLLMVPSELSELPAPLPWRIEGKGTVIDTICAREVWPDGERPRGNERCPGKEVLVLICPDGRLTYTCYAFRPARDLEVYVANEQWLRTKAMRSAVPPPLPGVLHGVPR